MPTLSCVGRGRRGAYGARVRDVYRGTRKWTAPCKDVHVSQFACGSLAALVAACQLDFVLFLSARYACYLQDWGVVAPCAHRPPL